MFRFKLLLLLIPWVSAQATQCAPDGSPQLHTVAQLSLSGCELIVHDTGASVGPHLAVEPIMCVTESLHNVTPRYDPVTQQTYVSVPVTLRDDAMLAEVQRQLRHLSPKSVKFATVSDISVSTDASSKFQALGFDWSPERAVGTLKLGCRPSGEDCSTCELTSRIRSSQFEALDQVILSAGINSDGNVSRFNYRLIVQNRTFMDADINIVGFHCLPKCKQLRFVRSVRLSNCTAQVHERLEDTRDMKGSFFIEPLLCHNVTSLSNEPVMYDYSRDKYYLKLDVVLQDGMAVDAVRTQLADLSPRSVTFMRLWRAQSHVALALSRRFEIGPLMESGYGSSGQLRVYCRTEYACISLRSAVMDNPGRLWRHIRYSVTSLLSDQCLVTSKFPWHPWGFGESINFQVDADELCNSTSDAVCPVGLRCKSKSITAAPTTRSPAPTTRSPTPATRVLTIKRAGRQFTVIQQQMTGRVSFQRTWAEYEKGFGDETDFWIGLSTIHQLSLNGATLRVEMKLWDGTELHAEYAGFRVGAAGTKYRMTYREMLSDRSSVRFDALDHHKGMQFSTMDRDNDHYYASCSNTNGKGGWWFGGCLNSNPNGIYSSGDTYDYSVCSWYTGSRNAALREVRLMLQM